MPRIVAMKPSVLLLAAVLLGHRASGAVVYLSPDGSDANSGTAPNAPLATPHRARDLAQQLGCHLISVAPGTYQLSETLLLNASHSGQQWVAPAGLASFSGGTSLSGWQSAGKTAGGLPVVSAPLPSGVLQDRHLYVNSHRATRTRLPTDAFSALFGPNPPWDAAKIGDDGFTLSPKASLPLWQNEGRGAEMVFPQLTSPWTEPRCAVLHAAPGRLSMMQPCWHNLRHKACGQVAKGPPGYIENVGPAYIAKPGDWAINRTSGMVVYAPRTGEDLSSMEAVMPALAVLLNVSGASSVRFEGLLFEHATWTRPGEPDGYVEQQTGCCAVGDNPLNGDCNSDRYWSVKSPGNVAVQDAVNVTFARCEFARLGGVGLDLTRSSSCAIQGCLVHDVSGSGIQIGSFAPNGAGLADGSQDVDNRVSDTVVTQAAVEYHGAAGINVGYTQGAVIEHNSVSNLSYVGISVGWGWSRHECWNCTNAGGNLIRGNKIHDYKLQLNDGGGIYMLGPQNNSQIYDNWVYNQGTASSGALYPDEGSAYSSWFSNVVSGIGKSEWLHLWTGSIHNVTVRDNFADTSTFLNHGTDCPMINNTVFPPGQPPAPAEAIMNAAGPRKGANPWM